MPYFLSDGNAGGGGIPEAPEDGKQYGREDAIWTEINQSGGITSENGFLAGANYHNCNTIIGFSNRFNAIKISSLGAGEITTVSGFIFNSYGARLGNVGIYDSAGSLIASTGIKTIPASTNNTFVADLISPVNIVSGVEYWIGVWGNGFDLPSFNSFANFGATFPDDVHAIQHSSATELPLLLSSGFPFALTTATIALNAFK